MSTITEKNKFISAYVDKNSYNQFQQICKIQGLSCNKALNILIKQYNARNKDLLSADNSNIDFFGIGLNINE
jgi:hypothetical protein